MTTAQRYYFVQDQIWNNASEVELKLLRGDDGRWFLTFELSGTIGKDPFDDDDDKDDDGALAEPKEAIDGAAVAQSIVADLLGRKAKKPGAELGPC